MLTATAQQEMSPLGIRWFFMMVSTGFGLVQKGDRGVQTIGRSENSRKHQIDARLTCAEKVVFRNFNHETHE